ncbi:MAG: DNA-processing protein DprA [Synergistales bacterium]|nr:DNA-processing protein DprA [Synergistales bacterium]
MKAHQKALLLLNSLECLDARFWHFFRTRDLEPSQVWEDPSILGSLGISDNAMSHLRDAIQCDWAEREIDRSLSSGITIVTIEDDDYPSPLKKVPYAPLVMYVKGQLPGSCDLIGIVGTRRCSEYARRATMDLARTIAEKTGISVVSGGALGVDTAAHRGALEGGGKTIAVLGTGVDVPYPGKNLGLFRDIAEKGALVSEYPLETRPRPWNFPRRNRIIAGLVGRLIVSEAPLKSGAVITARYSLDLGREIWAIPGRIGESLCEGSNRLIFDGAIPLISLSEFVSILAGKDQLELFGSSSFEGTDLPGMELDEKEQEVLELLRLSGERTVDNISLEGKMSAAEVLTSLGNLTARGLVYPSGPGRWASRVI